MKIAAVTEDGKTISRHFGRAPFYLITTVENGQVVNRELRDKLGHTQFNKEGHEHAETGGPHGFGPEADQRHGRMSAAITDCEAVLCGGMGKGAYESMRVRNIRPVVTDIVVIEEAVLAYASGEIVDHIENLH